MQYEAFENLLDILLKHEIEIDKDILHDLLKISSVSNNLMDSIEIILCDDDIKDKKKFIYLLLKVENDYLVTVTFSKLLHNKRARENDYYVNSILSEVDFRKRDNMCKALQNDIILNDENLFNFLLNHENSEIQRRIIEILKFDIGVQFLDKILKSTCQTISSILEEAESAIAENEKEKLETITKQYIENPSYDNLVLLSEYQKSISKLISMDKQSGISMKVQYVTSNSPKVLQYKK